MIGQFISVIVSVTVKFSSIFGLIIYLAYRFLAQTRFYYYERLPPFKPLSNRFLSSRCSLHCIRQSSPVLPSRTGSKRLTLARPPLS